MEIKIIKNPVSDLRVKHFKLVCFDDNDDEMAATKEFQTEISNSDLPVEVEFPVQWKEFSKELTNFKFYPGLYTVRYNNKHQGGMTSDLFHIEDLREIGDINEIMYIQQKFHYDIDKQYFETPKKFDFSAYVQYIIEHQKLFCIYKKNKLVAFAALETDDDFYISELIVDENSRGKGLGKALMLEVINYAKTHGNTELWTTLSTKNSNALEFYIRCGFTQTTQRWYMS